jgi:hypothetical protein
MLSLWIDVKRKYSRKAATSLPFQSLSAALLPNRGLFHQALEHLDIVLLVAGLGDRGFAMKAQ